ncbi:ATP-binding protein [Alteromonas phage vB_AemP_PT15-A5]|nr:ATP-binding protein [Alteromonas phage vB_AemP_PT15-A5]
MSSLPKVNFKQCKDLAIIGLKAKKCPMLHSSPGIGKSAMARQIAEELNLQLIDVRLSTIDPTDLTGFLVPDKEKKRADYYPPAIFPLKGVDEIPVGKRGWLLFLDEVTSAVPAMQAAAYRLILDKQIGEHDLHPRVLTMAAGNLATDKAVVNRMSTALQSRLAPHLHLEASSDIWIEHAIKKQMDSRVVAYVEHKPDVLNSFNPSKSDVTFACSRTMEFLSDIVKKVPSNEDPSAYKFTPLYAGTVGTGIGTEFRAFLEVYKDLISFDRIVAEPTTAPIPDEPSALFAMTGVIGERANASNIVEVMKYTVRLGIEHQVSVVRKIAATSPDLTAHQVFTDWLDDNASQLYAG